MKASKTKFVFLKKKHEIPFNFPLYFFDVLL